MFRITERREKKEDKVKVKVKIEFTWGKCSGKYSMVIGLGDERGYL